MINRADIIRKNGYKLTQPRIIVLDILEKNSDLMSAKDIFEKSGGKIDLASVYRSLNLFMKLEMIFEENIEGESYYYIAGEHHHHIICRSCGYVQCVSCSENTFQVKDFSQIEHQLTLTGICINCEEEEDGT
ncbi:Fur family transcriptional regulator [Elusimicrobiota bacterium]